MAILIQQSHTWAYGPGVNYNSHSQEQPKGPLTDADKEDVVWMYVW